MVKEFEKGNNQVRPGILLNYSYFLHINYLAMRVFFLALVMMFSLSVAAQSERDTTLSRCPVYIIDTVSGNNFFNTARTAVLKVYRVKGDLVIAIEQKDQTFSLFFKDKRLKFSKYKILGNPDSRNEIAAKYSFHVGDQVSYINVASGTVEVLFDKEKGQWGIKVNGLIANYAERSVSYYKVRANFTVK